MKIYYKKENFLNMKNFKVLLLIVMVFFYAGANPRPIAGDAKFGTHMAPLITAVVNTNGAVLEMGCGDFSTPLLHAICSADKRFLLSAEDDKKWMNYFLDLSCDWHQFQYVSSLDKWGQVGVGMQFSVVLVDHFRDRRIIDIDRLRPYTEIFVIHDTERLDYGFESVLSSFKYIYTYKRYFVTTTLVSDTVDVASFFEN